MAAAGVNVPVGGDRAGPGSAEWRLRAAAVWVAAFGVQTVAAGAGLPLDGLLVATAAVAAAGGRGPGAAFGFAAGAGLDLAVSTPFGLWALAGTVAGWLLGFPLANLDGARPSRGVLLRRRWLAPGCRGAAATIVAGIVAAGGAAATAAGPAPTPSMVAGFAPAAVLSAALAPLLFAAVGASLSPAGERRDRRAVAGLTAAPEPAGGTGC